jgi:ABC-type transporter Mla subunit MlaD
MALQDLTPQLRTRLRRVEKIVTLFVVLAALLLLAGFGYYLHDTGKRKGWFIPKCRYFTMLMTAEGLKAGDSIVLMGFNVGEIVKIETMPPEAPKKIFISFDVRKPYYGYIWTDSKLHIKSNLLGGRKLELMPGTNGMATVKEHDGRPHKVLVKGDYVLITDVPVDERLKGLYIVADEEEAILDKAQKVIADVREAIPGIVAMTNKVNATLDNVVQITSNVNSTILDAKPILANVHVITANLTNRNGYLGDLLIPTNLNLRLAATLDSVTNTLDSVTAIANTKIPEITANLNKILFDVSLITSNLNYQLESNDSLIGNVNDTVFETKDLLIETKDLIRGLKRHWLLKSAFPTPKLEAPPLLLEPNVGGPRP